MKKILMVGCTEGTHEFIKEHLSDYEIEFVDEKDYKIVTTTDVDINSIIPFDVLPNLNKYKGKINDNKIDKIPCPRPYKKRGV